MSTAAAVSNFPQPEGNQVSHLGHGVRIQGKIFSNQDLQVDGEVDGTLEASGHNLTIGSQAKVKADIKAQNVSISAVEGSIETTDLIELGSQCRVVGQIKTRRISIKDGAYFKGDIEVVPPVSAVAGRPRGADVAVIGMTKEAAAHLEGNELLATA
jgi:cytoskeletal protein CcmA (bactofilin family)